MLTDPTTATPPKCSKPNMNDPHYSVYTSLVHFTQGHVIQMNKLLMGNTWESLFPALYLTAPIQLGDYSNCQKSGFISFAVDSQTFHLLITVTASTSATITVRLIDVYLQKLFYNKKSQSQKEYSKWSK